MRSELKELSSQPGYKLLVNLFRELEELAKARELAVPANLPAEEFKGAVLQLRGERLAWERAGRLLDEKLDKT